MDMVVLVLISVIIGATFGYIAGRTAKEEEEIYIRDRPTFLGEITIEAFEDGYRKGYKAGCKDTKEKADKETQELIDEEKGYYKKTK